MCWYRAIKPYKNLYTKMFSIHLYVIIKSRSTIQGGMSLVFIAKHKRLLCVTPYILTFSLTKEFQLQLFPTMELWDCKDVRIIICHDRWEMLPFCCNTTHTTTYAATTRDQQYISYHYWSWIISHNCRITKLLRVDGEKFGNLSTIIHWVGPFRHWAK